MHAVDMVKVSSKHHMWNPSAQWAGYGPGKGRVGEVNTDHSARGKPPSTMYRMPM